MTWPVVDLVITSSTAEAAYTDSHRLTDLRGRDLASLLCASVTFRPRSTSVAGTVSNAEGFACCCRAANDEDGYRVGPGQEFELTAVEVGHLGRSATWR